ncbi:MAG: TrkA domain protein [Actinomycetota bacterium]|jgi:TrkA domain protein
MSIEEHDLPGIGRRYDLGDLDGSRVSVVIHHGGRRDIYLSSGGDSEPSVLSLNDRQARQLGAILGGAYFQPAVVAEIEAAIGGLLIDWVTLDADSRGVGRTIAELEIRRRTRMTVVAILREHTTLTAPEPAEALHAGDQLVIVGRREDLAAFTRHVVDRG